MRRLTWVSLAASATTLWIDALLMIRGDTGPLGWALSIVPPLIFSLPAVLIALWALRKHSWAAAGIGGGTGLFQVFTLMGLCFGRPTQGQANLKVLTYNVGQFEAQKWPEPAVTGVADTIRRLDPDIACLQEAHYHGRFQFGTRLANELPGYHAYAKLGMMVLSKRPFLRTETQEFPAYRGDHWNVQEVAIQVGDQKIRVINVHMVPAGYEPYWWPKLPWLAQIERKRRLRDDELSEVLRRVDAEPGPVMIGGDFNTQPSDPRYRRLAHVLTDVYKATNTGFGYTLTSKAPFKRVDYVWTRGIQPLKSRVGHFTTSDHFPFLAELRVGKR